VAEVSGDAFGRSAALRAEPCFTVSGKAGCHYREARVMPRLLDLFCCAGGAAEGYVRAGFEVVGVDIKPQPRYPYAFIQHDALRLDQRFLRSFDAIHASPPCQRFSDLAKRNGNADEWPDLIAPVRRILIDSGKPYVIENVEGAPLIDPIMLCGTMFPLCRVIRHRLFEVSHRGGLLWDWTPQHRKHPLVYTRDKRKTHYGKLNEWTSPVQVTGGGNCSKAAAADAMGINWMTKNELNEAIPPAYTQWIGQRLKRLIEVLPYQEAA
jgi:DNA (cytosine-5)-methyltransferase 1